MQFKIPFSESREKFCDFDGDGDVDVLFRPFLLGRRIYLYTNTVHRGILDDISTDEKTITSIDLGERWFTRNAYINVRWRFESEKLKNIVDNPSLLYTRYLQEFQIVLAVLLCIIIGLSLYAAKSFKKREPQWELLWTPKRVILYFAAAIVIPPAALGYFIYKVVKESDVYRSALGFIRITRKQILISGITGLLLFAASWCLLMLFTLNRIMLPDTSETEYIVEHYFVVAAFLWGITAPIVEEIVFSGYTYPLLRARVGVKLGIVGCALLFSVLHLKLVVVPVFFMAAVIKLYAYERTHCIYVPVIIHFINNLIVITTVSLV
jgi:membrane protease YdiL (CAAX protease family)